MLPARVLWRNTASHANATIQPAYAGCRLFGWGGNLTFGLGIVFILSAITYGIQPYGDDVMAWTSPRVLTLFGLGLLSFASPIRSR